MAAHGGNVAQGAGNAAVAYGSGWVPSPAKMHIFDAEIGGNQQFRAGGRAQDGAIVPDATPQSADWGRTSKTTNCLYEVSFLNHKSSYNYIKNMNLCLSVRLVLPIDKFEPARPRRIRNERPIPQTGSTAVTASQPSLLCLAVRTLTA